MAIIQSGASSDIMGVDAYNKSARVSVVPRGAAYRLVGRSGLIAAATNGHLFTARLDPSAPNGTRVFITRLKLDWSTITAFTVPITDRWLELVRGAGAAPSGGSAIAPAPLYTSDPNSEVSAGAGGIALVATTGALTVAGITFESNVLSVFNLTNLGAAGATGLFTIEMREIPIILAPGEMISVRNAAAMDAAGTARLSVGIEYYEGVL